MPPATLLPREGTVFRSSAHLKLTVQRIALTHDFEVKVNKSHGNSFEMRCRLNIRTGIPSASQAETCKFGLRAGPAAEPRRSEARRRTRSKIDEYEAVVGRVDSPASGVDEDDYGGDEEDAGARQGRCTSSRKRRQTEFNIDARPLKRKKVESRSGEDGDSSEADLSDEEATSSRNKALPHLRDLSDDIDKLLQRGLVAFPSANETFLSARALLIRLHAHARTHGSTLQRSGKNENPRKFFVQCSRGNARFAAAPGGQCRYRIVAERGGDGSWRTTLKKLVHNHPISGAVDVGTSGAKEALPPATKMLPPSSTSPDETSSQGSHVRIDPPAHSFSNALDPFPAPVAVPVAAPIAAPLLAAAHPPVPHTAQHHFQHDLAAFLVGLLPALTTPEVHTLATALVEPGMDSVSTLAMLLLFWGMAQRAMLDDVILRGGMQGAQADMILKALAAVAERVRRGLL